MVKVTLWDARDSRDITLIELSKKTGISKSTLNNFENKISYPNILQLEKIAIALNCKITDLFESEFK